MISYDSNINEVLQNLAYEYSEHIRKYLEEEIVSIVLYGSVARCEATSDSDIDLYIVLDTPVTGARNLNGLFHGIDTIFLEKLASLVDTNICTRFSLNIKKKEQAAGFKMLYLEMIEKSVLIYDKDSFMESVLNETQELMKKWGSKKIDCGTSYYWDLKPDRKKLTLFNL